MKIVVIGATGHIGSYLVPKLLAEGHEVIAVSRNNLPLYSDDKSWEKVHFLSVDRAQQEMEGIFGSTIAALGSDIVIDLICFTKASAEHLINGISGKVKQLISCGTIWIHGSKTSIPSIEDEPKQPLGEYGQNKLEIETYLLSEEVQNKVPTSVFHPGHLVGEGWFPLNPAGNFSIDMYKKLKKGEKVYLPNWGLETLHHVHTFDVARLIIAMINQPKYANGQAFNAVSNQALTTKGFAEKVAQHFGNDLSADFVPISQLSGRLDQVDYSATVEHISHSSCCSNQKAKSLLNFEPCYSSIEAITESIDSMLDKLKD